MTFYEIIYMLVTVVTMYTISKYMHFFMPERRVKAWVEFLMYAGFYVVIVSTYFVSGIPLVNMLINLVMYGVVSLACRADLKTHIWSIFIIYIMMMCIEILCVVVINGMEGFSVLKEFGFTDSFCQIVIGVMSFIVAEVMTRLKRRKYNISIPINYWFCIIVLPVVSLYVILVLFMSETVSETVIITATALLLLVNILIFRLYDVLSDVLAKSLEKKYLEQQISIMQVSLTETKKLKHDLKNHLFSLQQMLKNNERYEALKYVEQLTEAEKNTGRYVQTGNAALDSILNYKLWEAEQQGIKTDTKIAMSGKPEIVSYDASIIFGNLFDNAITASINAPKKEINFEMLYDGSRLIVAMSNYFSGILKKDGVSGYETTKKDKKEHGFGLKNVRGVLVKYDGELDIIVEDECFQVSIIMFI